MYTKWQYCEELGMGQANEDNILSELNPKPHMFVLIDMSNLDRASSAMEYS